MKQVWEPAGSPGQAATEAGEARLRVAVAGIGRWGTNVLRVASGLRGIEVEAVAEPRLAPNSDRRSFSSLEELLQRQRVDAVLIATPPDAHYEHTRAALSAGCHVFVEKPLAQEVHQAEKLVSLALQLGRRLMVGHILRYHPGIAAFRELLLGGELGAPRVFRSLRQISRHTTEDPWWCLAPHDLSLAEFLLGSDICRLACRAQDRSVIADFEVRNGGTGRIEVGVADTKESSVLVECEDGCVEFSGQRPALLVSRGVHRFEVPVAELEPLRLELQHFASCIRHRRNPTTDGAEGVRVVRALCAGDASRASGGGWQDVSIS